MAKKKSNLEEQYLPSQVEVNRYEMLESFSHQSILK